MRFGECFFTNDPDRCAVDRYGMIPSNEPAVRRNDRMSSRHTVAVRRNGDEGVDNDGTAMNASPYRRRRFHELFLKRTAFAVPEDGQCRFRTLCNALSASDTGIEVECRIPSRGDLGRSHGAHLRAHAALRTAVLPQARDHIRMHTLFLCPGRESHGDIFNGATETRGEVPLEMRKNDETTGIVNE